MIPADAPDTRPDPAAQFRMRGYVVGEEDYMILADLFAAMDATAFAYDMDQGGTGNFDLSGDQVAALLRSFVRLGRGVLTGAAFADGMMAGRHAQGGGQ